jgi:hypothetical protein
VATTGIIVSGELSQPTGESDTSKKGTSFPPSGSVVAM